MEVKTIMSAQPPFRSEAGGAAGSMVGFVEEGSIGFCSLGWEGAGCSVVPSATGGSVAGGTAGLQDESSMLKTTNSPKMELNNFLDIFFLLMNRFGRLKDFLHMNIYNLNFGRMRC
jgi:hypothetical protein